MASILTNPNKFLVNVPELQNVVTSATGSSANSANNLSLLLGMIDVTNKIVKTNGLQTFNNSNILVRNNLNLSNSQIYYNNVPLLLSNGINATNNLVFKVNNLEIARFTSAGFLGIGVQAPLAPIDVLGDVLVRK
jgi:hypothetical protein